MDVYSFGISLLELLKRGPAWPSGTPSARLLERVAAGERPALPSDVVQALLHTDWEFLLTLIQKCWRSNPAERPTFLQVRKILDDRLCR